MDDLTGKTVELQLPEELGVREKVRGALFQNGDRGIVIGPSSRIENGWLVSTHDIVALFFTDELRPVYEDAL